MVQRAAEMAAAIGLEPVSSKQIVEALSKKGIRVDKRKLQLEQSIASLGVTRVPVDLYRGQVIGEIVVHVSEKA